MLRSACKIWTSLAFLFCFAVSTQANDQVKRVLSFGRANCHHQAQSWEQAPNIFVLSICIFQIRASSAFQHGQLLGVQQVGMCSLHPVMLSFDLQALRCH